MSPMFAPSLSPQKPFDAPRRKLPRWSKLLWLLAPLLLWWALRDIPLAQVWQSLKQLDPRQILVLIALNAGIILLMSSRWWLILRAQGYNLPYLRVSIYRLVSFGISYFTPGPQFGGEPAQVYFLQKRHSLPGAAAVASVSLDKILELLANLAFLLFGLLVALQAGLFLDLAPTQTFWLMAGPFAVLLAYTFAIWRGATPLASLLGRLVQQKPAGGRLPRLQAGISESERQIGLFCREKPLSVLLASGLSALIWAGLLLEYWVMLRFLGLGIDLPRTIAVMTLAQIAFLFPLPGGLGALEASLVLAMQSLGLNPALGISISLLIRARDISLGGLGLLSGAFLTRQPDPANPLRRTNEEINFAEGD